MAFGSLILTNLANTFTAQAWASSGVITITRVGFGSGFPGGTDYVPGYTGLKTPVMNGTITGINNLVSGQLTVRANISSANAPFTFNVNEIGIFGKYAGGAETLLAYCTTGANTGDTVTPTGGGTPVIKDYALLMIWQQAISSSGVIQLLQIVGLHAGSHLNTGVDPISVATSSNTGFVPVSPGDGLQVPISTSPVTWAPALLVINVNTTLYVSTTGNDSTALPNDITHPWLTIQGALNYLKPYFITPGNIVTVSVAAGNYVTNAVISVNHPQGNSINIVGATGGSSSITAVGSTSGSSGAYSIPFTVSSAPSFTAGDYAIISIGTGGTAPAVGNGMFPISSVVGNVVTVTLPWTGALGNIGPISSGTLTSVKTIISPSSSVTSNAMVVTGAGLGLLQYVVINGTSTTGANGLAIGSGSIVNTNYFGVRLFGGSAGINISPSAMLLAANTHATQCATGIYGTGLGCFVQINTGTASYNTTYAVRNESAYFQLQTFVCIQNYGTGILINNSAHVNTINVYVLNGAGLGVKIYNKSALANANASLLDLQANGSGDLNLNVGSTLANEGGTLSIGTRNVTNNTLSADGCYLAT